LHPKTKWVPRWSHERFGSGSLMVSGCLSFCRVVPLCPLGLPGKRLVLLVWSPLCVGYMRFEAGLWGFSWRIRLRLRVLISALRLRFSCELLDFLTVLAVCVCYVEMRLVVLCGVILLGL
jgi:hypothetical protein